jgi:hypothetical integral membrane protein (TIGR02206 family)
VPESLSTFHPFALSHLIALAWTLPWIVVSCWLGRRFMRAGRATEELRIRLAWAVVAIIVNAWSITYWFLPEHFDIGKSLPLQLCDVAGLVVPLALIGWWRWARTLLYFWGIGLSTQAFITPTVEVGMGHQRYWLFWLLHLVIVGGAVYDLVVHRYRPRLRDLVVALAISIGWLIGVFLLNIALGNGANYGYVGDTHPENPTIIDALGPWPLRAVWVAGIGIAVLIALWGIWLVPGVKGRGAERGGSGAG